MKGKVETWKRKRDYRVANKKLFENARAYNKQSAFDV